MMNDKFDTITIDFQNLFASAPNIFVALSTDLKIIGASDAFLVVTQAKRNKIMGKSLFEAFPFYYQTSKSSDIIDEMDLEQSLNFVLQNKETHTMAIQKISLPKLKGGFEERYWSLHNIPVLFEQQQLLCIIHKVEDVTEMELMKKEAKEQLRKKNELEAAEKIHLRKLKESEARFMKIFDLSPVPIFMLNLTDFKLVLVNCAFEKFLNVKLDEILSNSLLDLGFIDIKNQEELTKQLAEKGGKILDIEFNIKLKTGEIKKMLASSEIVEVENRLCYLIAMIDITTRKNFENNLIQSNHFLDTILENIPNMVFVKDANDLSFIRLNKAGENLLGFTQKNMIGKTNFDIYPKDLAETITTKEKELFENSVLSETEEVPINTVDGERWLQTKKIPVFENNKPVYLVGISEDITERKKQQDAILQLNKELEAFSYSVSHDLRAPLRAVTGYAQILDEDYGNVLDSEGKRLLGTISENAEKMGHLIDNLLTFSRLGRKELQKKDTNMKELVEGAIAEIRKSAQDKATIKIDQLHNILSDPELMTQAVINLIDNAIKYSSKNDNSLIEISSYVSGGETVFCFHDNGAGFDMRYYDKLFGVFQRLHSTDEFEGTGVGLAIVQRIITKHGGKVWAKAKINEGATFCFSVPSK